MGHRVPRGAGGLGGISTTDSRKLSRNPIHVPWLHIEFPLSFSFFAVAESTYSSHDVNLDIPDCLVARSSCFLKFCEALMTSSAATWAFELSLTGIRA
ncbi:hypothetical protein Mapa_016494 [Marchantia paleacea]|nr:hypothetical protein Mapa_016494 [Marchantia paleacea]